MINKGINSLSLISSREVQKALGTVNDLYRRWKELLENQNLIGKEEYTWTTSEIKNNIRSIEWDLEDLNETICIVETNPMKFQLTPNDIQERRRFINEAKGSVRTIKEHVISPEVNIKLEKADRNVSWCLLYDQVINVMMKSYWFNRPVHKYIY